MLGSFLVYLRPRALAPLGRTVGRSLHALLLAMIAQVSPTLAEALHADARVKPFTVSMLNGHFIVERGRSLAAPDRDYWVRYTVLSDNVFAALSHVLLDKQHYGEPVTIDGQPYSVTNIVVEPERSQGWAQLASYQQLMDEAGMDNRLAFEFASPTTFRQGKTQLLFPLPQNVFGSYARRWNGTAPSPLDVSKVLDLATEHVVAERYKLETRVVPYDDAQYNGFVGHCQYRILTDDRQTLRLFNLLADFALFSGTGQKTTQGMGQTRRLNAP